MAGEKEIKLATVLAKLPRGIVFKGYRSGLILAIPDEGDFLVFLRELEDHLVKAHSFFKNARVSVQTGKRRLTNQEETSLTQLLQSHGLILQPDSTPAEQPGNQALTVKNNHRRQPAQNSEFIATTTVKKTVRSGQKIQFEGNLLIIGDVNPGAEVVASGDIVVLGKLRGIAHAGADGDEAARIFALQLNPVQIRIAGIFTRDSDKVKGVENQDNGPEMARIKDGLIVVERY
jgi:septum site-determining protein MinC